jgi:hypothetical protein
MADRSRVTLGTGALVVNGVDVGYLKGDVEFVYTAESHEFKPSTLLGTVQEFKIREGATLKASIAELKVANLKLAMGIDTSIEASTSWPSDVSSSCSYNEPNNADSYDVMTFGGDKSVVETCLRFTHTRPNGQTFHVVFYRAVSINELTLPFHEEEVTLHDVTFRAQTVATRAVGDQIGTFVEQTYDAA